MLLGNRSSIFSPGYFHIAKGTLWVMWHLHPPSPTSKESKPENRAHSAWSWWLVTLHHSLWLTTQKPSPVFICVFFDKNYLKFFGSRYFCTNAHFSNNALLWLWYHISKPYGAQLNLQCNGPLVSYLFFSRKVKAKLQEILSPLSLRHSTTLILLPGSFISQSLAVVTCATTFSFYYLYSHKKDVENEE